jgi:hypothetical protein
MKHHAHPDPLREPVTGIIIYIDNKEQPEQLLKLLKTLDCEVVRHHSNRMTVKALRGKLQALKKCWTSNDPDNAVSKELNACVEKILIGR